MSFKSPPKKKYAHTSKTSPNAYKEVANKVSKISKSKTTSKSKDNVIDPGKMT
jgi:hypothetical protein